MSDGRLKSAVARFWVPASSAERAETSWAFVQPGSIRTMGRGRRKGEVPVLIMVCTLACGSIIIIPDFNVFLTTLAPFSMMNIISTVPLVTVR